MGGVGHVSTSNGGNEERRFLRSRVAGVSEFVNESRGGVEECGLRLCGDSSRQRPPISVASGAWRRLQSSSTDSDMSDSASAMAESGLSHRATFRSGVVFVVKTGGKGAAGAFCTGILLVTPFSS